MAQVTSFLSSSWLYYLSYRTCQETPTDSCLTIKMTYNNVIPLIPNQQWSVGIMVTHYRVLIIRNLFGSMKRCNKGVRRLKLQNICIVIEPTYVYWFLCILTLILLHPSYQYTYLPLPLHVSLFSCTWNRWHSSSGIWKSTVIINSSKCQSPFSTDKFARTIYTDKVLGVPKPSMSNSLLSQVWC